MAHGDLDPVRILDLGAFELDHAQRAMTTDATPSATLTLGLSSMNGLDGLLGLAQGEIDGSPFGALPVHLWGTTPGDAAATLTIALAK